MKTEPVMTLVVALIAAAGGLLAAFGVDVTAEQITALSTFAVAALGLGLWVRSKVTPTAKTHATPLRDERGYGLVEVAFALLIVIVALAVLVHFL